MTRNTIGLWLLLLIALAAASHSVSASDVSRWWPTQSLPKRILRTDSLEKLPAPHGPQHMLVQSLAGLAAKAVNEGRGGELIWVTTTHRDLEAWFGRFHTDHPEITVADPQSSWQLLDRLREQGIVQGYILYRWDTSPGKIAEDAERPGIDMSVNIATSLAGILHGVLIDESLVPDVEARGLPLLLDARDKSPQWCFETYRDQFCRQMLCMQDPRIPNCRDLAIAHNALTLFGKQDPVPAAMQWLEPLSPILGWPGGDEFQATRLSSIHGHIQTATNWCMNLPVLMAGSERQAPPRAAACDPRSIDFSDARSAVSFICTDGDNVQWYEGGFFRVSDQFWESPARGRIPYGWSCCFTQLAQLCPQVATYAIETRSANDWFVEWGGGYYYPDLFGSARPDRWDLLARHARRTLDLMRAQNVKLLGFNVSQLDSPDAMRAYETIAREADDLLGLLVFQYAPYEAGAGKTYWVPDRLGQNLPVITARYSIWSHSNSRPRSGTPAKVAREIQESVGAQSAAAPRYDWVIAHVWSYFRPVGGTDEEAENVPQDQVPGPPVTRGYAPSVWCAERLPADVRVVSPEELVWRIRMQQEPEQTRQRIAR